MTHRATFCIMTGALAVLEISAIGASAGPVTVHTTAVHISAPKVNPPNTGGMTHVGNGTAATKFEYSVQKPYDNNATGQATGRRQHDPIHITKETNTSSPNLLEATPTNETLDPVASKLNDHPKDYKGPNLGNNGNDTAIQELEIGSENLNLK